MYYIMQNSNQQLNYTVVEWKVINNRQKYDKEYLSVDWVKDVGPQMHT